MYNVQLGNNDFQTLINLSLALIFYNTQASHFARVRYMRLAIGSEVEPFPNPAGKAENRHHYYGKGMEAAGIEPASESSPLKASTLRSSYFDLVLRPPTSRMPSDQPK